MDIASLKCPDFPVTEAVKETITEHSLNVDGWNVDEGYRVPDDTVMVVEATGAVVQGQSFVCALRDLGQDWIHDDDVTLCDGFHNVHEDLKANLIDIDQLNLDPANAMTHPQRNIDALKTSLSKYQQRKTIVVQKDGMIVRAGNGTLIAAKALGWTHIAAIIVEDDDVQATAFAIMDNQSARLAVWDYDTLGNLIDSLPVDFDILDTGFTEEELTNAGVGTEEELSVGDNEESEGFADGNQFTERNEIVISGPRDVLEAENFRNDLNDLVSRYALQCKVK